MTNYEILPSDLEMRARLVPELGRTRLTYTLHSPTGSAPFTQKEIEGPIIKSDPESFHNFIREKLEQLGNFPDSKGEIHIPTETERQLTSLGHFLWNELFPYDFRQDYRAIRRTVRTWMIVTDESWIPWELIKPYDNSTPENVIDDDFLGRQFQLTRWLAGSRPPSLEIEIRRFVAVGMAETLPQGKPEEGHLAQLALHSGVEDASPSAKTLGTFLSLLNTNGVDLVHFIGHSTIETGQAGTSAITFSSGLLHPSDLTGPVATRIAQDRPLVFLNTCSGGQWAES